MLQAILENLEKKRIQNHLKFAELTLRSKDSSLTSETLSKKRSKMLNELHAYWVKGVFPKNTNNPNYRESYFVDTFGTPCAMGYLMLCDNQDTLVRQIQATDNNIHLSDLTSGPAYDWIKASGFSQQEASLVQPTYGGRGMVPVPYYSPFSQYIPWILGTIIFIILEFLSFQLLSQPLENTRGKRIAGVAYYTVVNLVISSLAALLIKSMIPSYNYFNF